jgi:phage virion morphogenesis protein
MITIQINDDALLNQLAKAVGVLGEPSLLMGDIGETLLRSTKKRFGEGKAPDGSAWAPNSPVTLARKKDSRPLFGPNNRLNKEFGLESGSDYIEIASVLPYAGMMQFGGSRARFPHLWGDIPARPFLGLSEDDRVNVVALITNWVSGAFEP